MADIPKCPRVKVVLVGETRVGKTSIINRFVNKTFSDLTSTTVAAGPCSVQTEAATGPVILDIWDTAGQEQYRSIATLFFRGASAAALVLDVTDHASFDNLTFWHDLVRKSCDPKIVLYVIGNKTDLESDRAVIYDTASEYATSIRAKSYMECSAKDGVGVDDIFGAIIAEPPAVVFEEETVVEEQSSCC
jgi:Ras-related protein Rab-5C